MTPYNYKNMNYIYRDKDTVKSIYFVK